MSELYIGLMSGTSLDGVDGVLADFSAPGLSVLAYANAALLPELRRELLSLNSPGDNELHRAALAANALVRMYAGVVASLLEWANVRCDAVTAIGAHGQTVRHQPQAFDGTGYSLQLNNPALLAELTSIDVVADFRSRDVAAGGLILKCAGGRFWTEPIPGRNKLRMVASNGLIHHKLVIPR